MKKSCPYLALKPSSKYYMRGEIGSRLKMKINCFLKADTEVYFLELYKDFKVDNSSYDSALSVLNQWKKRPKGQIEIKTSIQIVFL